MGWTWYLTAYEDGLEPRAIGAALATYSIITIAGCLVVGRARWLSSAEVFGLLFAWTARVPRRLIRSWQPPPGTGVVLGVLAGGLLFGLVRGSPLWAEPSISNRAGLYATLGVLGFAATGATMMRAGEWWAGRIDAAAVAASSIPLVAGLALALSLARNRLFTSLQLLPILASDPFGRDWDLFGTADWMLDPNPLGDGGRTMVQILVLTGAGLASAVVVATGAGRRGRLAATAIIALVVAASVAAVTTS
jgi:hypothetical protein